MFIQLLRRIISVVKATFDDTLNIDNMPLLTDSPPLKVHLIGIGGIGVSALARWFLAQKWAITGSDTAKSAITEDLHKQGLKVKIGHKSSNLPKDTDLVIYSSAVLPQNPELKKAKRLKIQTLSYPEALGRLTKIYDTIAVSGSHGKSTTTALTSLVLMAAKQDPTVIIGTKLKEFGDKNFRSGKSDWLVIEADEWQASFLRYSPFITIVTNIDREHLDFYKNISNLKNTFIKFIERTRKGGALILNQDDENLFSLKPKIRRIALKRKLKVFWYSNKIRSDSKKIRGSLHIPGEHNLSNAMAAFTLARVLKIKDLTALKAIGQYRGSWRRMEYRGRFKVLGFRCEVFDDYAHHPTEIKATLKAFKEKFPSQPLVCVYQPHQAKRLKALFEEFQTAFDDADITLIAPLYRVLGRDKVNLYLDSKSLVKTMQKKYPGKLIFYISDLKNLKKAIRVLVSTLKPNTSNLEPIVVMMGAGDIVNYTKNLLRSY